MVINVLLNKSRPQAVVRLLCLMPCIYNTPQRLARYCFHQIKKTGIKAKTTITI